MLFCSYFRSTSRRKNTSRMIFYTYNRKLRATNISTTSMRAKCKSTTICSSTITDKASRFRQSNQGIVLGYLSFLQEKSGMKVQDAMNSRICFKSRGQISWKSSRIFLKIM